MLFLPFWVRAFRVSLIDIDTWKFQLLAVVATKIYLELCGSRNIGHRGKLRNIDTFCCVWVGSWWVVQYWHILLPVGGVLVSCAILTHFVACGWSRCELCNIDIFCCLWAESWWVVQYWHILLPMDRVVVSCAILTHFVACGWGRGELCNIDTFCCLWVEGGFRERKMLYRWRGSKRSSLMTLWTVFLARHRMEVERTQDTQ